MIWPTQPEPRPLQQPALTAHIETGPGQHVPVAAVAHQVVSRLLPGAVELVDGDAHGVQTQEPVAAAGQGLAVQRPVQRAGDQAQLRAERARGCEAGANGQDRILGGDLCNICNTHTHTHTKL